jgi:hypothetical protein
MALDLVVSQQSFIHYGHADDEVDSDELVRRNKSSMLRKKSGELVRSALRLPSAKLRLSSMPGILIYFKAVYFDSHLEHVRHFL